MWSLLPVLLAAPIRGVADPLSGSHSRPKPVRAIPLRSASFAAARRLALLTIGVLAGCSAEAAQNPEEAALRERARALFGIVQPPTAEQLAAPQVALGRRLFWDERISLDGQTACASCHTVEALGADARRFSEDARGRLTSRNSQTIFNAMEQPQLRWLADRSDGAHQAERSIAGSMGFSDAEEVIPVLNRQGYEAAFQAAFPNDPQPVSPRNYGLAIQSYLATLITPAAFDAYLAGDSDALTSDQKEGMELFADVGCAGCHSGPLLGGGSLQKFGVVQDYWTATGSDEIDPGRFAVTSEERDRYVFRVPMLRNIAGTAPYFHDGSVATLPEAVAVMARVQLGRELTDRERDRIVAFLESLTGQIPANYAPPEG